MAYTISQIAQRFGVEPHTLRFYEKEGILHPQRTPSGIRTYSEEDVVQMEVAMCLKSTGMPLKEIKRYFDLVRAEGIAEAGAENKASTALVPDQYGYRTNSWTPNKKYIPIAQAELDSDPALVQNNY